MDNTEFINLYGAYLAHKWVTSKDKAKAEQQKAAERAYNHKYYEEHKKELLDKAKNNAGKKGPLTREEALDKLNKQQEDLSTFYKLNPKASMADQIAINKLVSGGMSKEDAKAQVTRQRLAQFAEDVDIDIRNARASATAKAQGEQMRKNYETLKRRQSGAEATRSRNTAASIAQASAAAERREIALRNEGAKMTVARNTAASIAQASAAAKRREKVNRKLENRIKSSINRAITSVSNAVNSTKASVKKVSDYYNRTTKSIERVKNFTTNTINKYFG